MNFTEKIASKPLASHSMVELKNGAMADTRLEGMIYEKIRQMHTDLHNKPHLPTIIYEIYDIATGEVEFEYPLNDIVAQQIERAGFTKDGVMPQQIKDIVDSSLILNDDFSLSLQRARAQEDINYNKHI